MDRVLQRLELENKKEVLKSIQLKAKTEGLNIATNRGQYEIGYITSLRIVMDISEEIKDIDEQLEEITGLNQNRMKELYEV